MLELQRVLTQTAFMGKSRPRLVFLTVIYFMLFCMLAAAEWCYPKWLFIANPERSALAILLVVIVWISHHATAKISHYQVLVRLVLFTTVILATMQISVSVNSTDAGTTIILIDTSTSITDASLNQTAKFVDEIVSHAATDEQIVVIGFAGSPYVIADHPTYPLELLPRHNDPLLAQATNISKAIKFASAFLRENGNNRIILISDLAETNGHMLSQLPTLQDQSTQLYFRRPQPAHLDEVAIHAISSPETIAVEERFYFDITIFSTYDAAVRLVVNAGEPQIIDTTIDLHAGLNTHTLPAKFDTPGFQSIDALIDVDGADVYRENNRYSHGIFVTDKPKILYIDGNSTTDNHLIRALTAADFDVTPVLATQFPTDQHELDEFDLIIFSDVPAAGFTIPQLMNVQNYVDGGGGFLMIGGENSFSSGGYYNTPIAKILPVQLEPKKQKDSSSVALLLVIDKSGSMAGTPLEMAKEAAIEAMKTLKKDSHIGVIAFDSQPEIIVPIQNKSNEDSIEGAIRRLNHGGGTNLSRALETANELMAKAPSPTRHIIALTDGISDTADIFSRIIPEYRRGNISVSTVALGEQSDPSFMRRIASLTNGRFHVAATPYQLPRIFSREAEQVSTQPFQEKAFRPRRVVDSQIFEGIAWVRMPDLLGYSKTAARQQAQTLLESHRNDPILATWQYGLGRVGAFTSDAKNRWSTHWLGWTGFSKFWAQLVRELIRPDDNKYLPLHVERVDDGITITLNATTEDWRFSNDLLPLAKIYAPSMQSSENAPLETQLSRVAPGLYQAHLSLANAEINHINIIDNGQETKASVAVASISIPYLDEYRVPVPNPPNTGTTPLYNALVSANAIDITHDITPVLKMSTYHGRRKITLTPYFLALAVLIFLSDLSLRRLNGRRAKYDH